LPSKPVIFNFESLLQNFFARIEHNSRKLKVDAAFACMHN
jgi:hypothetical protein